MSPSNFYEDDDFVDAPRPFLDRLAAASPGPAVAEAEDDSGTVRPYFLTGGRTSTHEDVNIETMVSLSGAPYTPSTFDQEHLRLLRLAREPIAVAEIAVHLAVPIGVAMVLTGDLAEAGVITLNNATSKSSESAADDVALLRKVISGVRTLRNAETV
jgi:hypothetical protein